MPTWTDASAAVAATQAMLTFDDPEAWVNEENRDYASLDGVSDRDHENDGRLGTITGRVDRN